MRTDQIIQNKRRSIEKFLYGMLGKLMTAETTEEKRSCRASVRCLCRAYGRVNEKLIDCYKARGKQHGK